MSRNLEIARQAFAEMGADDYRGSAWIRATEIPFDGRWASILWIRDGKVVRAQGHMSRRRAMRAAGLEPEQPP
ncbi:MAG TPA: hypothetical protein VG126_17870 [Thermoleophilaceae bacterium]|nr:hypothetical protein [Thermoleophilaceae bacterium]